MKKFFVVAAGGGAPRSTCVAAGASQRACTMGTTTSSVIHNRRCDIYVQYKTVPFCSYKTKNVNHPNTFFTNILQLQQCATHVMKPRGRVTIINTSYRIMVCSVPLLCTWSMLKPGVDIRSASRSAESSALSRLMPEEDGGEGEEEAMGDVAAEARPRLQSCCDLPVNTAIERCRIYDAPACRPNHFVQ